MDAFRPPVPLPSLTDLPLPRVLGRANRRSNPPRPRNRFILFRSWHKQCLDARGDAALNQRDLSKRAAEDWRDVPQPVKKHFAKLAALEVERHKEVYPNYKYCPRRSSRPRGTREVAAKCRLREPESARTQLQAICFEAPESKMEGE